MQANLTKTTISNLPKKGKAYVVWDKKLSGFGIKVNSTGRKVFVYQARVFGSKKTKRITIGGYLDKTLHKGRLKTLTVHVAREIAEIHRGNMKAGVDPTIAKENHPEKLLMNDLLDLFVQSHFKNLKPRTAGKFESASHDEKRTI